MVKLFRNFFFPVLSTYSYVVWSFTEKLAPLFCKQYQKKTDHVVNVCDEARKLFLHSGLPEVVKKKFEEQKKYGQKI